MRLLPLRALLGASLVVACGASPRAQVEETATAEEASIAASEGDAAVDAAPDAEPSEIEAEPDPAPKDPAAALAEKLQGDTPIIADLRALTLGIGGREGRR